MAVASVESKAGSQPPEVLMSDASTAPVPLVTMTDAAKAKVLEVRAAEPEPEATALWLEVSGVNGATFTYDMYFRRTDEADEADAVQVTDDVSVVVPEASIDRVRGSRLDFTGAGMVLDNPNRPGMPSARPDADLSGDVPQMVLRLLEDQVNPMIASHGGRADLVAVEDGVAYLRLGGGCQGCGMAAVTLSQGIEKILLEGVPEIHSVVDVTDHASGENPYFEAAKK